MSTTTKYKKLFSIICSAVIFSLLAATAFAQAEDWYVYNGASYTHSFSVRFPTDWQAHTFGNSLQGFSPQGVDNEIYFSIREFDGQSYDQVIDYFVTPNTQLMEIRDEVKNSSGEELLAKRAIYRTHELDKEYSVTFIKRGSSIFALSNPNLEGQDFPVPPEHNEIIKGIYDTFTFTDNWLQYIDYKENYTFIFPSNFTLENLNNGVEISTPSYLRGTLFRVSKYRGQSLDKVALNSEGYGESFKKTEELNFHNIENSMAAIYHDQASGKDLSRIFIEKDGNSYGLTNINIEDNFPHLNYYDQYLVETLESFEFFSTENAYSPFEYFADVRETHPNAYSINALRKKGIIDGYQDETFKPDGEINRAELTKMIVSILKDPKAEDYNNCFSDVTDQWFAPYVCFAKERDWIQGYEDGKFNPENPINRAEAMKIIFEVLLSKQIADDEALEDTSVSDVDVNDWYAKYYIFADNHSLLDKQHVFKEGSAYRYYPDLNMTRKEVAESIYRSGALLSRR